MCEDDKPRKPRHETEWPETPVATGISQCLRKLAVEAADLGLMTTNAAIRHAAEVCADEMTSLGSHLQHFN